MPPLASSIFASHLAFPESAAMYYPRLASRLASGIRNAILMKKGMNDSRLVRERRARAPTASLLQKIVRTVGILLPRGHIIF